MRPESKQDLVYHGTVAAWLLCGFNSMGWAPPYLGDLGRLIAGYPLHLIANLLVFFALSVVASVLLRRKALHFSVLSLLVLLLAFVHRGKHEALGQYLAFGDLVLLQEAASLGSYVSLGKMAGMAALSLLVGACAWALHRGRFASFGAPHFGWPSVTVGVLGALGGGLVLRLLFWGGLAIGGLKLKFRPEDFNGTYKRNGYAVAFLQSIYGQRNFLGRYQLSDEAKRRAESPTASVAASCKPAEDPDIVIVMVESLFDPLTLPGVRFGSDPLAPLRDLPYPTSQSHLLVPVYGGLTANTEFEVLTGAPHRFFPQGTVQYQQHLHGPSDSWARLLARRGYRAQAVHNYNRRFWRRDEIYPNLGFEAFHGVEEMSEGLSYHPNHFPKDEVLAQFVPALLEREPSRKNFAFVVTVGMHGSYERSILPEGQGVDLSSEAIDPSALRLLRNYTNLLFDSSLALEKLARTLLDRKKPTLIAFFGDHLPAIPHASLLATGYMNTMGERFGIRQQQDKVVPLTTLNNFKCQIVLPPLLGSNCLASSLSAQLFGDKDWPPYWSFNREFCGRHPYVLEANPLALQGDFSDYAAFIYQSVFNWEKTLPAAQPAGSGKN
jgi:phosphoglycerol transferase MdoB-like AlkP superfamily enzyme